MNIQCHLCVGGTSVGEDIFKLEYGQRVVPGALGQVFDVTCRSLGTRNIEMFVLDEVNESSNEGFKDQNL